MYRKTWCFCRLFISTIPCYTPVIVINHSMFQSPIISHQLIGMISPRHFATLRSPRLAERLAANGFWGPLELLQERLAVGRKMTPGWGKWWLYGHLWYTIKCVLYVSMIQKTCASGI